MTKQTAAAGGTGDIQVVRRVADIVELFSLETPRMTVAEAAERLGLNRTTVHRYVSSLIKVEILARDSAEPAAFVPGRLLLSLAAVARGRQRILAIAPRHLDALAQHTGLTSVLSLWGSTGPVVFHVSEPHQEGILVTVRVGTRLGIESAQTRLFLALMRDRETASSWWRAYGAPVADDNLREDIRLGRETGLCRVAIPRIDGEVMARAVFDPEGMVASIAVIGTNASFQDAADAKTQLLRDAADAITAEMEGLTARDAAVGSEPQAPFSR